MAMIRCGPNEVRGHDGAQPDRAGAEDGKRAPGRTRNAFITAPAPV